MMRLIPGSTVTNMLRFSLLVAMLSLVVLFSAGQDGKALFRQAPPEVDEALRKAVQEFTDAHNQKKWGAALKFVADDSFDLYIGRDKESCVDVKLLNIDYNDTFTKATVGMICERRMATPIGGGRMPMPYTDDWELIDGVWKWHVIKIEREGPEMVMTPFGPVPRLTPDQTEAAKRDPASSNTFKPTISLAELQTTLSVSPEKIVFTTDKASTAVATIRNKFAGIMRVDLRWVRLDGLSATIDKQELNAGETAEITVKYEPKGLVAPPKQHAVWVETNPMRSATPIMIEFQEPGSATAPTGQE